MDLVQLLLKPAPLSIAVAIVVVDWIIRIVAIGVIPHNRRPSAAWGWLLAIYFVPLLGVLVYLVLGGSSLPRNRKEKQRTTGERLGQPEPDKYLVGDASDVPDWVLEAARMNHVNGGMPMIAGNDVHELEDYDDSLAAITEAVRGAESYVHLQFYIMALDTTTDPLFQALEEAHRRGVIVRVLMDHLGSLGFPGYKEGFRRLKKAGVPCHRMLPVRPWRGEYHRPDLRNHRKIIVVDGRVAFTGSQNAIDRSYNKKKNLREHLQWKDLMVRAHGPVVAQLNAVFITDWYSETNDLLVNEADPSVRDGRGEGKLCQILPSGPGFDNESNLRLFNHLFYSANCRITVSSPYLVPDAAMFQAITTAVQRGVEVRLYMGTTADHAVTHHAQRSYYEMLAKAGVKIFLYKPPYVLHSKLVLIDDDVAVVASSNMDIRSFTLNLEVNLMVCDRNFVARLDGVIDEYRAASSELNLSDWLDRPWNQKYLDNAARLTAALQ